MDRRGHRLHRSASRGQAGLSAVPIGYLAAIGTGLATDAAIIILRRVGGKVKTTSMLGISARRLQRG